MTRIASLIALASLVACGNTADTEEFTTHREMDASEKAIPTDGSNEAIIAVYLANSLDLVTLDDDVTLDSRAAANIIAFRAGTDGVEGTADDQAFTCVADLDAVSYVGSSAFADLIAYGEDMGLTGEVVLDVLVGSPEEEAVLFLVNELGEGALDDDVSLDSRAAANIVAEGSISTLSQLDGVSYVGPSAMGKLLDFAEGMLDGEGIAIRDGAAYDTLQDAVDASASSITIQLYKGTYTGETDVSSTLIIRGYSDGGTVFDGEGSTRSFTVSGGSPCFYDMDIINGGGSWGGAVYVESGSSSTLFDNVLFENNHGAWGGAVDTGVSGTGTMTFNDVTFMDNTATYGGGAIYSVRSIAITGSLFEGNDADYAAAIRTAGPSSSLTISDSEFVDNMSVNHGALSLANLSTTITGSSFEDNSPWDVYISGSAYNVSGDISCDATVCN